MDRPFPKSIVLQHGTLGGRFTTLEGILDQVYEELSEKVFASGDSSDAEGRSTVETFLKKLKEVRLSRYPTHQNIYGVVLHR